MFFFTFLVSFLSLLSFSSFIMAQENVDYDKPFDQIQAQISSFQSRHSLMPIQDQENDATSNDNISSNSNTNKTNNLESESNNPVLLDNSSSNIENKNSSDTNQVNQNLDVEPVIVSGNNDLEPVVLKRPEPKVQKPEGYDELMEMARQQGGVIKPSNYTQDKNGMLVLNNDTSSNQVDNIKSNLIIESKDNVVNKPLFQNNTTPMPLIEQEQISSSQEKTFQAMAHVASYLTSDSAKQGIIEIEQKYPQTNIFEPFINYEYVPGKGNFFRLYFVGDERELQYLCRDMQKNSDWCNIIK